MKKQTVSLVLAALLLVPAAASAKECHPTVYEGTNAPLLTGRFKDAAQDAAVLSWGASVSVSVGIPYANWNNATDKKFVCTKTGKLYKCFARARPCRP